MERVRNRARRAATGTTIPLTGRCLDADHRLCVRATGAPDVIILGPAEWLLLLLLLPVVIIIIIPVPILLAPIVIVGRFLDDRLQHPAAGAAIEWIRFRCLGVRRQPGERNVIRDVENVLLHHCSHYIFRGRHPVRHQTSGRISC
uniref:Uncharacterized protein n=1 Tax=Anopheles atroparvus TaxID=41427 RepID=A0A182IW06_ANOAO